jgi:hypothetical protein
VQHRTVGDPGLMERLAGVLAAIGASGCAHRPTLGHGKSNPGYCQVAARRCAAGARGIPPMEWRRTGIPAILLLAWLQWWIGLNGRFVHAEVLVFDAYCLSTSRRST